MEQQLLWIDWKCLAKASATAVGSAKFVVSLLISLNYYFYCNILFHNPNVFCL
jgi:hypothetical protein